jgi:hypothetical protein
MKDLNIELAEVVMGWTWHEGFGAWIDQSQRDPLGCEYNMDGGNEGQTPWAPADGNMNQIWRCWNALDDEQKATFAFENRFAPVDLVFTNPRAFAQKILRAKQ